jgi:hypothetical protein
MNKFHLRGRYPENLDFAKLIKSIGIVEQIKASTDLVAPDDSGFLEVFKV